MFSKIGAAASPVITLTSEFINLIVALSPEHAYIRDISTYLVSGPRYANVKKVDFLTTGLYYIYENIGYTLQDGVFKDSEGKEGSPTRIVLEIVKPT